MANRMVDEQIIKNIKDPSLVDWILPSFSTTLPNDRIVASVSVMSTLQAFFTYKFSLSCGIPNVTLLGTVEDWEMLRAKFDRLLEFEVEGQILMAQWHSWLSVIGDNLLASVKGENRLEFWDKVCSNHGGGSGPSYISGWISTFSVFTEKGEFQGNCFF
jgi:hypothetical protein